MIKLTKEELNKLLDFDKDYESEWEFLEIIKDVKNHLILVNMDTRIPIIGELIKYDETDDKITIYHDVEFKIDTRLGISLGEHDLEGIYRNGHSMWEGWSLKCETDKGDFDAEKGAMTDFECSIYYKDEYLGTGRGSNCYTGVGGVQFYSGIDFEIQEEIDRDYIVSLFNNKHNSDDEKVDNLINYISAYYE